MNLIRKKLLKNKKGQSAIELAIIFPILAMLMIYLFDVAMVINAKMTVNAACRAYIRIVTLHGATNDYTNVFKTAKRTAESILNQNSLTMSQDSLKMLAAVGSNGLPKKTDIHMHERGIGDGNPEGKYMVTMKICTEVPIRLNKVMGLEIWGKNTVKNGKLPVCSQYVSAISSKQI